MTEPCSAMQSPGDSDPRSACRPLRRVPPQPTPGQASPPVDCRDTLTGLPNRAGAIRELTGLLLAPTPAVALLIDLDNFGAINGALGTSHGDSILREVGRRLQSCVGPRGFVARLGSDEFLVASALDDDAGVPELAGRVLHQIASDPVQTDTAPVLLRATAGVVIVSAATSAGELLRHAAVALRAAKADGPGSWMVFDRSMLDDMELQFLLAQGLAQSLLDKSIVLAYQPIVDLASGRMVEVEALLRWVHPVAGPVNPAEAVVIAESWGLIDQLGAVVLRQACNQAVRWHKQFPASSLRVGVNFSTMQLRDLAVIDVVTETLRSTGCRPDWLTIEITESCLLGDAERAVRVLGQLRALGVHLSLDDFGTGYSGLSYLTRLPFDTVKVDRSFLTGPSPLGDGAFLETLRRLATGFRVLAEGVEDDDQRRVVTECGFDLAQGWLFGRPQTPEQIAERLAAQAAVNSGLPS